MSADSSGRRRAGRIEPGARIGSYLVERPLGTGGMGSVYAGKHVGLEKPVVIKALHDSLASSQTAVLRFVREGRAASKIRHPHVVDVTDVGTHEGVPYLVMEYLEGEDLQTRLGATGKLTPSEIARIMLPVLDAVSIAHDLGIVHRDLKPSNVFLARTGQGREIPKVLDFGIAKILETDADDQLSITHAAVFLGTPYYCSPEQARSSKGADARSDQYAIGAMIYELATGMLPVPGKLPFEVLSAIMAGHRVPITTAFPRVSPVLAAIVERAMAHRPEDRFPSLRDLGRALLEVADPAVHAQWSATFSHQPSISASPPSREQSRAADPFAETILPQSTPSMPSQPGIHSQPGMCSQPTPSTSSVPPPSTVHSRPRRRGLVWLAFAAAALLAAGAGVTAAWWVKHTADTEAPLRTPLAIDAEPAATPVVVAAEIDPGANPDAGVARVDTAPTVNIGGENIGVEGAVAAPTHVEPEEAVPAVALPQVVEVAPRGERRRSRSSTPTPSPLTPRSFPAPQPTTWGRPLGTRGANNAPILD